MAHVYLDVTQARRDSNGTPVIIHRERALIEIAPDPDERLDAAAAHQLGQDLQVAADLAQSLEPDEPEAMPDPDDDQDVVPAPPSHGEPIF